MELEYRTAVTGVEWVELRGDRRELLTVFLLIFRGVENSVSDGEAGTSLLARGCLGEHKISGCLRLRDDDESKSLTDECVVE